MGTLKVDVVIERERAGSAPLVVVPAAQVARWKLARTTTIEGTLDGKALGRRSLKRLDRERWFIELPRGLLESTGKAAGDRARLVITRASSALPAELGALLDTVPEARRSWDARSTAQQRMLREEILAAKTPATRERRARRALLPVTPPAPAPIRGLSAEPRGIELRIVGRRLPGRTCGPYTEVAVGLAHKVGCDPDSTFPADVREARWKTRIEVREQGGAPAFRGPAVNGPPDERFLYLTWIGRQDGAAPAMFRRAKLRLDAIPAPVLAKALRSGELVGRLELTACDGMPVCASVRPPAISWTAS